MLRNQSTNLPNVLVVDDDADLRRLVAIGLGRMTFNIIEAGDANQGLAMARGRRLDLVLLDIDLPGKNGWTFLKEFKGFPQHSKVPVVIITGKGGFIRRTRALLTAGAAAYVTKPFTPQELRGIVHSILA